jgi:hypothetical protein
MFTVGLHVCDAPTYQTSNQIRSSDSCYQRIANRLYVAACCIIQASCISLEHAVSFMASVASITGKVRSPRTKPRDAGTDGD